MSTEIVPASGRAPAASVTTPAAGPTVLIAAPFPGPVPADDARLVELWLHGRPASTAKIYTRIVNAFMEFVTRKPPEDAPGHEARTSPPEDRRKKVPGLRGVTLKDLQRFADSLAHLKPATRATRLSVIKGLFGFAIETGYLPVDPARALRVPRPTSALAERIVNEPTVARIIQLESIPLRRMMLHLFYATGIRMSEMCTLRWEQVHAHGDSGVITVAGKGGRDRTIRLTSAVWAELAGFRPAGGTGYVFASARSVDRPVDRVTLWRWFKAAAARVGGPAASQASPHWFRHARASHALDHGAPVHLVARTLGHASIEMTTRYAHARPDESSGDYLPDPRAEAAPPKRRPSTVPQARPPRRD
jgi:integrase/recombinase XerD